MKVLIHFTHGLGDAVQLTVVLQHLARLRPDWELYLQALRGKHSAGHGYCLRVWHDQEPSPDHAAFDRVYRLDWWECYSTYTDSPSTKACNCLREVFGIQPMAELCHYRLHLSRHARQVTAGYLEEIGCRHRPDGRYNAVVIHYEGNTSTPKKNLRHDQAAALCETALALDHVPVILDWDRRSPLPDGKRIHNPHPHPADIWGGFGSGDAERIAALVEQSALMVGIDSGPQKCAGATSTPTIAVWTGHHPVQFFDLSDSVTHLLPADHFTVPPAQDPRARRYFAENYRHVTYSPGRLTPALCELAAQLLGASAEQTPGRVRLGGFWCHEERPEQDWVVIDDIYRNDAYRTYLIPRRKGQEYVVDVGAHIGTFARLWHERNPQARIVCVEACPENVDLLAANVGEFAEVVQAACTYEPGPVALLNAVNPRSQSTGGSRVVRREDLGLESDPQYLHDQRELARVSLEELMRRYDLPRIDVLKLDCEGSEYSILEHGPIDRVGLILGEYHGFERWEKFRQRRFPGWEYTPISRNGEMGNFHLRNPAL